MKSKRTDTHLGFEVSEYTLKTYKCHRHKCGEHFHTHDAFMRHLKGEQCRLCTHFVPTKDRPEQYEGDGHYEPRCPVGVAFEDGCSKDLRGERTSDVQWPCPGWEPQRHCMNCASLKEEMQWDVYCGCDLPILMCLALDEQVGDDIEVAGVESDWPHFGCDHWIHKPEVTK